ncbi:uncharacterized protein HD556DRAFT_952712 [Suillus plorans]|uniref:Uncharacterized protein n=1 Tax=Suillus plorans TaxID=116603 RepID=A0A9P7AF23_9AGAM|nr:uncharacterized protein HD556DRAFT_952712 [Suillus plorans]KAG1787515.1 hypothetical protein HD556DRAFT_952712 [Suillus plorans]
MTREGSKNAHKDFKHQAQFNLDGVGWFSKEELEGATYPRLCEPGNDVGPLKLVMNLYHHAQAHAGQYAFLSLHTQTPMAAATHEMAHNSSTYTVVTNRGSILWSRIVYATNMYASYLLPFLVGPDGIIRTRAQVLAILASVGTDQIV